MTSDEKIVKTNLFEVVRRLWPVLRPYRWRFGLGIGFILLTTTTEILSPIVIGRSVDAAIHPDHDVRLLVLLCLSYLALIAIKAVLEAAQAYVIQATGQAVTHDLRAMLFEKIQGLPVGYFDQNPTGRLLTRVVNDIKSLSELFTASISVLALDFMIILGTLGAMFWLNAKLAAMVLVSFPLVLLTIRRFGKRLAAAYRRVRIKLAEINAFLGENIGAIITIQRLGAEAERERKFTGIVEAHQEAQLESIHVFAWVQPITNVLNGISTATLMAVGGYRVVQGKISLGVIVAFLGYLRNLFQPVRDLVEKYNTFLSAMVSAERVVSILEEKGEMDPEGVPMKEASGTGVRFEKVGFCYPLRHKRALENVSFDLPGGASLAVVGATGSGKSTLVRLLLRFYEPQEGTIYFGELPLNDWNKERLRRSIGVVHQEIYLFQGTIRENLSLGREGYADSYLVAQCERAQLWDFIKHRGTLDMPILEGGSNLSLGERQLLSFARILVFDPPVLILDEATSSVDRLLEKRLMEAVRETIAGRTSIVIAHRLSTIRRCDSVLVLEHGHLVEQGTYEKLLLNKGRFAHFHEIHSRS